jgi:GTP-binding protein
MKFVDQVRVLVRAGRGGDGAVAWRREANVPRGGPAGGDGGRGGDVVFEADQGLSTLLDLRFRQHLRAEYGKNGGTRDMNGRGGEDLIVRVPVGTMVFMEGIAGDDGAPPPWRLGADDDGDDGMETIYVVEDPDDHEAAIAAGLIADPKPPSGGRVAPSDLAGELVGDLTDHAQRLRVAEGGRGGRGNIHFRSSTDQAPDRAEPGGAGEAYWLRLELKLLADVGIVGFPNVGKSTLIRKVSRARPRVGAYPFTTLVPNLGVASLPGGRSMVVADVPGLIEGASQGKGLGHQFLRHLERTRVLLHLLAPDPSPGREPLRDLDALEHELASYGDAFDGRPRVVALNKSDTLTDVEGRLLIQETRRALRGRDIPLFVISAQTGEGVDRLLEAIYRRIPTES